MNPATRQMVERQVARVRRRLFVQALLFYLAAGLTAGLVVAAGWMLLEPYAVTDPPAWLRWTVGGSAVGVGLLVAIAMTIRKAPNRQESALSIDERFGLKERIITSFSLTQAELASPAGQALLADVHARVQNLKVSEHFPIRFGWSSAFVPVTAAAVALIAIFYHPDFPTAQGDTVGAKTISTTDKSAIEKKLAELQRKPRDPASASDRIKSEELRQLEAKLEEIAKKPRDTTQQLRDRIKEMTPLEEEIKKLDRDRTEKNRLLQQQLMAKDQLSPNENPQAGPARDLQKALADGKLDQAKDELDRLGKKLLKNELTEQEKDQLAKQLNDLQKKLDSLANQRNKEEQLKKLHEEGKLDADALKRELDQLKQDNEKLKDLQKLAQKLNQCQKCMKAGDMNQAAQALSEAAGELAKLDIDANELDDLKDQLQKLQDAKDVLSQVADGTEPCPGGS